MRGGRGKSGLALLIQPDREEASLWRRFSSSRESRLREGLFGRYRRFARLLASRHARRLRLGADHVRDLEQLAYRGLLEAIDRYDPMRGASFLAFAKARINGSIIDGLGRMDEFSAQQRFKRRQERERATSLLSEATRERSAVQELANVVAELALGLMLEAEERSRSDPLVGNMDNGFDRLAWRETRILLRCRVSELPEPEQTIIRHHYENDLLFSQIAAMLGLSKGRVSQLHKSGLEKLRKSMRPAQ